ncbi:hypothetical protein SEA_SNEK_50 [Arthrobacter phage Snek]|uniref:Uncharacterized protein n=1 Tax=Arthrobacter phage Tweety19 TaxID=2768133 RepID=A0A7G9W247_9CAUD|nr:hypothetical protein PQE19_gp58 [Arthrobacter phage Tweety19]QNO12710.1 hypothetical protein SEA_TWEETY19_51 [Arthrobacter phage Tweety19]
MFYVSFRTASGRFVRKEFATRRDQRRWILRAPAAFTITSYN